MNKEVQEEYRSTHLGRLVLTKVVDSIDSIVLEVWEVQEEFLNFPSDQFLVRPISGVC